jgi:quercetin dioxygenase-like cupin family protein
MNKKWGTTELIFSNNNTEIFLANIIPGGYSSKHCHKHKYNLFFVKSGKLIVRVWSDRYEENILCEGDRLLVSPGVYHQFLAQEHTVLLEIYYVEIDENDIDRIIE